jgi:Bacteriophage Sf6, terminase small subunit-like
MVEDVIDKYHRKKAERLAAEAAETERLRKVAARKASTPWAPEIGQAICDAVADGGVLKDICQTREDLPTLKIVREWIRERPGFAQALKEAERVRLYAWEDELLIKARDDSKDRIAKDNGFVPDPTAVARAKLLCDTLARLLKAHYPSRWGDASILTVQQPETNSTDLKRLPIETLEAMRDNSRLLEQDQEVREMLQAKRALTELNRERRKRNEPPLSLAKYLSQ